MNAPQPPKGGSGARGNAIKNFPPNFKKIDFFCFPGRNQFFLGENQGLPQEPGFWGDWPPSFFSEIIRGGPKKGFFFKRNIRGGFPKPGFSTRWDRMAKDEGDSLERFPPGRQNPEGGGPGAPKPKGRKFPEKKPLENFFFPGSGKTPGFFWGKTGFPP